MKRALVLLGVGGCTLLSAGPRARCEDNIIDLGQVCYAAAPSLLLPLRAAGETNALLDVAASDVNGDGRQDLVLLQERDGASVVRVFLQVPGAFFVEAAELPGHTVAGGVRLALGPIDANETPDLLVLQDTATAVFLRGNGVGGFFGPIALPLLGCSAPQRLAARVPAAGDPEVLVACDGEGGQTESVNRLTFVEDREFLQVQPVLAAVAGPEADVTGLFVRGEDGEILLGTANELLIFTEVQNGFTTRSVPVPGVAFFAPGFFDGGGRVDLAVAGFDGTALLVDNGAELQLAQRENANNIFALAVADFDLDGEDDLLENFFAELLFFPQETQFQEPTILINSKARFLLAADPNEDGLPDVVSVTEEAIEVFFFTP